MTGQREEGVGEMTANLGHDGTSFVLCSEIELQPWMTVGSSLRLVNKFHPRFQDAVAKMMLGC